MLSVTVPSNGILKPLNGIFYKSISSETTSYFLPITIFQINFPIKNYCERHFFRFSNFLSSKASETEESENSDFNNSDDDDDSSDDDDDTDEDDVDTQPKFEPLGKERKSTMSSGIIIEKDSLFSEMLEKAFNIS